MVKHIPNMLSIFRIVDLAIVLILMEHGENVLATAFFALGVLSDVLDGIIARANNAVTIYGKIMDPLADKILVIGVLIAMIKIIDIPYWMVIVIVAREFAVTGLRAIAAIEKVDVVLSANWWGKLKTTSQFVAIVVLMLGFRSTGIALLFVSVILTLISGYVYFHYYFKAVKE